MKGHKAIRRGHTREGIVLKEKAYLKEYTNTVHLVTIENSIQPQTTTNFGHKDSYLRIQKKTLHPSS
jgi:hypothetical protein